MAIDTVPGAIVLQYVGGEHKRAYHVCERLLRRSDGGPTGFFPVFLKLSSLCSCP